MTTFVSARNLGLLRVLIGWLVWSQWAAPMRGVHLMGDPIRLALSAVYWCVTPLLVFGVASRSAAAIAFATLLAHAVLAGELIGVGLPEDPWVLIGAVGLLASGSCGASWSLERWRAVVRAEAAGAPVPSQRGPWWTADLLVAHLCLVQLAAAWRHAGTGDAGSIGIGVVLAALTLGLIVPGTRQTAILPTAAVHAGLYLLHPGGVLTPTALVLLLAAVRRESFDRGIDQLLGRTA